MSSLESKVDPEILERILDWASDIEEFERHHAVDGLFHAKGFTVPPFDGDREALFLLALDISFLLWLDDRSDSHLADNVSSVRWDELISVVENREPQNIVTTAQTQETQNLLRLFRLISIRAASEAEYSYWKQTMSQVIHGMSFEDSVYRDGRTPAYIECIEYGIGTSLIPNVLSTSALVYRVSRVERQKDLLLASLERCFSIQQRLINDIKSVEKEMLEGAQGKCTNAFLLLANRLGFEQANNFMQDEIVGISRVISALTSRLGHTDPFVKLIRHASIKIDAWYESNPQRCKP